MNAAKILTMLYTLVGSLNPVVSAVLAVVTISVAVIHYFNTLWGALFARLDTIALTAAPGLSIAPFGLMNSFFPLDTLLSYLTTWFGLYLLMTGIRMIKSFIPTISS